MVSHKPWSSTPAAVASIHLPHHLPHNAVVSHSIHIIEFIQETTADLQDLENFYSIAISRTRIQRVKDYLVKRKAELVISPASFGRLTQQEQVDWLLIDRHLTRRIERVEAEWENREDLKPLIEGWVDSLVELCERRQKVTPTEGKYAAQLLSDASSAIEKLSVAIKKGEVGMKEDKFAAYRAALQLNALRSHLKEWYHFYQGYDPVFTWWTAQPWANIDTQLAAFVVLIREKLVDISPGDEDAIVGQPIGRKGIEDELRAEMIPYSPEELIQIGDQEYEWCEEQAIKASQEMGFGRDWRKALEHIKGMHVEPGQQAYLVHELAEEAIEYVSEKHDMVTVPEIAKECWRTTMMTPQRQKTNPFFLGGEKIIVSYPKDTMSHEDKTMVMRGNSRPLSRSTVFHELLPGHHLQTHWMTRSKPHRQLFATPFWMEGWAVYWEMLLWDRGFPCTPENRMGMLFWRMHRCARITFSLRFHLGLMTPQECIDYLVEKVGHERATAEGEVRRSFNGDYGALYQAGYMIGALQIYALRREVVDKGGLMTEKGFHDRVLRENNMPIELLRALLKGEKLTRDISPSWRFYDV